MPEMRELTFDTGLVTFTVNGACQVSFNPTDVNFAKRLCDAFMDLEQKEESYKATIEKLANKKEIFEFTDKRDREMREIIDGVFGVPVCEALFGEMNVYAMSDGMPAWANFMLSVMDEMNVSIIREQKATNPRIAKYTKKYHK